MAIAPRQRTEAQARKVAEPSLKERYEAVKGRIAAAAARSGQPADRIVLVAVTKYASTMQIRELLDLGHVDFAENRVQALVHKHAQIEEHLARLRELGNRSAAARPVRWHMIGHLQRNKVRKLIGLTRLIQSVDSLRLAEEIQAATTKHEEPVEVLVQVNVAREKSKYGIAPAAARHLIEQIDSMFTLRVRGLMCMAPLADDPKTVHPIFERCRELFDDIVRTGAGGERFDILSMGMSNDFEVAIDAGAKMVRVGSAIFGQPPADQLDAPEADEPD